MTPATASALAVSPPVRRPRCRRVGLALLCERVSAVDKPHPPAPAPPRQVEAWVPNEYVA